MRLLPPLTLLVLAPFVGEFLLGNITPEPSAWAVIVPPLVLLYGGGAVLIREVTRRLGRGYPTMVLFAIAYALIEEGVVLATLFNRDYLGLDLLEYGWIPQLGTSPVWSGYVIGIHTVWSILVPVVLTEHLFPHRARQPWLQVPGTVVVAVVYLLGAVALALGNHYTWGFLPDPVQLQVVLALAVGCVAAGVMVRTRDRTRRGGVPAPWLVGTITAVCGSVFVAIQHSGPAADPRPYPVTLAVMVATVALAATIMAIASRRVGWTPQHTLAATSGALVTYAWAGFSVQFSVHGFSPTGLIAQVVFVGIAAILTALCWRRSRTQQSPAA